MRIIYSFFTQYLGDNSLYEYSRMTIHDIDALFIHGSAFSIVMRPYDYT